MLKDRAERNKLRHTVLKAEKKEIISSEEVGFIVSLVERFRGQIDKKTTKLNLLKGQLAQLKENRLLISETKNEKNLSETRLANAFLGKFIGDLEKKSEQLEIMKGELAQLRANEASIIDLISSLIKAKERDIARQETFAKLREAREVENQRHKERKKKNAPKEQEDVVKKDPEKK